MKKLFLFILILGFCLPVISAEYDDNSKLSPARQMQRSFEEQDRICKEIASNFRMDPRFSAYVRNLCNLYTVDRERTITNLFPTQKRQYDDDDNSRIQTAKYIIAKDTMQINYYRQLTDQYCKNRISKKDPQACDRLEDIFESYDANDFEVED